MNVVHEKRSRSLFEKFPRNSPDRARLTSLTAPFSGSWLTTPPTDPYFTLDDTHFSLAVRLRLGIAPVDDIKRCFCGASLLEEPLHFQSCRRLGSSNVKSAQYRLGAATFQENSKIKHYGTRATQRGNLEQCSSDPRNQGENISLTST